jgi:hypothetical protein
VATSVYEVVEIELQDGSKVEIKPLKIALLREFMKEFDKFADEKIVSDNVKSMDVLVGCVAVAMKQYKPEYADRSKLEDVIDLPTVYKIIEVASGIKMNDPNALAAALVGTN